MDPSDTSLNTPPSKVHILIERSLLFTRHIFLLPFYIGLLWGLVALARDFYMLLLGKLTRDELVAHTIHSLELVDVTMIANLIWFIAIGSCYVFILPYPFLSKVNRPRCLTHVSAGLLKEKMASSIVGIALVYLLTVFFDTITTKEEVDWKRILLVLGIFLMFNLTLWVFCKVESAPHHAATKDD